MLDKAMQRAAKRQADFDRQSKQIEKLHSLGKKALNNMAPVQMPPPNDMLSVADSGQLSLSIVVLSTD